MLRTGGAFSAEETPRDGTPLKGGFVRGAIASPDISTVWNDFRLRGATGTLVVVLVLGIMWGWVGGYVLAGIAAVAVVDARARRKRTVDQSLFTSVALDLTLIGAGIFLANLQPAAIGTPYLYMMAVPLLLLPLRKAMFLVGYSTAWAVVALAPVALFPPPDTIDPGVVTAIAYTIFATQLLFLIAIVAMNLERSRKATAQRLRNQRALTIAGQKLLANVSESAMADALDAIREATDADAAFVGENRGDRKTGPSAVVNQVSAEPDAVSQSTLTRWTLPYMQHREAAAALARGEAVRLDEMFAVVMRDDTVAALGVPVTVGGEWAGFLGVAHSTQEGATPEPDLQVLETVAAMIGAHLDRRHAYMRLEQLIRSKDQFLASVSHEIRTPLTSVLGFASVLKEDPEQLSTEDGREIVELIRHQALEVSDLVEDLLVAARAEIDAVNVVKTPVTLSEEINSVLSARLGTEQSDIFVASSPSHRALADPTRVRQILRNLLTNALRYGGEQITITTHRDGPEVIVVFSDNGEGIPADLRRRVFEPYERGDTGLVKPESIGLGLAVSRQLARLMDGDLTLRADLGNATFQLTLPLAPKEEEDDEEVLPDGAVVIGNEVHITVSPSEWGVE